MISSSPMYLLLQQSGLNRPCCHLLQQLAIQPGTVQGLQIASAPASRLSTSLQAAAPISNRKSARGLMFRDTSFCIQFPRKPKQALVPYGLPETAASVAVAATVVGAAATILARRTKSIETAQAAPTRTCDDCGGSGICPECKGEGFVLKRMADGSAEKARLNAKNMATRYTAGLPKKWSYCTKCLSARSCKSCDGSGKLSF